MSLEPHRWTFVSTIKAPTKDILNFAAHYPSLGATHLYLFLDFPDPEAQEHLEKHAHIRVTNTAPDYWQARGRRRQINMRAYPKFGAMVSGGVLSHQVGKSFFRIVPELMAPRIHFCDYPTHSDTKIKTLANLDLAHYHTSAWDKFYQKYRERRASGSYRKVISGGKTYETGRKSLHDILEELEQNEGVAGLKRLHRELCIATPELIERLEHYDLYRLYDFNFDAKRAQYFPQFPI